MGGYLSTFTKLIWAKKEIRILILGLVRLRSSIGGTMGSRVLITNAG